MNKNLLPDSTYSAALVSGILVEIYGEQGGSGWSVSGAGDVNNDGFDDIIIGAPGGVGESYLILGKSTNQWEMNMSLANADASFIGETGGDSSGFSVSGAGDVNNDSFDDIIIGVPNRGSYAGESYLILGRPTNQWNLDISLADANASFIGETGVGSDHESGKSVSGVGDVNNDGFDDIIIGAPGSESNAGQSYLILGRPTNQWSMDISLANVNASFIGEVVNDQSGWSVSGAGDVNNDSFDDIMIGAYNKGLGIGESYLILGRPTNQWSMDMSLIDANASFIGETADDYSGFSVSGAGDVNNDGFDDIIIGAFGSEAYAGQSYLILGRPTNFWSTDRSLADANASFIGETTDDWSGRSVSGAGDVNNDGFDDIIIGAYGSRSFTGQSYLILGKPTNQWSMDMPLTAADAYFIGEAADDYFGYSVSGVGDVNNDSYDEIIIGAPSYNIPAGPAVGKSYLIMQPLVRTITETSTESYTTTEFNTKTETKIQETTVPSVETSIVTTTELGPTVTDKTNFTIIKTDTKTEVVTQGENITITHTDSDQADFGLLGSITGLGVMVLILKNRKSIR
ncbi:MAG: integrin alpha [Candidatus Kariarchaeaceae archaeon]